MQMRFIQLFFNIKDANIPANKAVEYCSQEIESKFKATKEQLYQQLWTTIQKV